MPTNIPYCSEVWDFFVGCQPVSAGCESGPNRRPAELDWFRSVRDQCAAPGVPFYLKQLEIGGKVIALPELDGVVHDATPWEVHDE